MVAAFSEHAELVFEGIPVGPFSGRDEIARLVIRYGLEENGPDARLEGEST
jgi:hypothetical protein